jgi:hypothetical protein
MLFYFDKILGHQRHSKLMRASKLEFFFLILLSGGVVDSSMSKLPLYKRFLLHCYFLKVKY